MSPERQLPASEYWEVYPRCSVRAWLSDPSSISASASRVSTRLCGAACRPRRGEVGQAPRHRPGGRWAGPTRTCTVSRSAIRCMECSSTTIQKRSLTRPSTPVFEAFGGVQRFVYEYDFGDSWTHEVVIEDFTFVSQTLKFGVPRRRGGVPAGGRRRWGAMKRFLQALADPFTKTMTTCWPGWASCSILRRSAWRRPTPPSSGCADRGYFAPAWPSAGRSRKLSVPGLDDVGVEM